MARVTDPWVQRFWEETYNEKTDAEQRRYYESTRNKVDRFFDEPIVRRIVGQPHTTFDIPAILAAGGILFVQLDQTLKELTALVGSVIIELIGDAAFDRPAGAQQPFFLYVDECQRFATTELHNLIPQIRKFGVGITLAHQWRGQFRAGHPMREATTGMGNIVVFRVKPEDAKELAEHFNTNPDPRRQLVLDPLGHLEREGHPDDRAHDLVRRLRQLLARERARLERQLSEDRARYTSSWGWNRPPAPVSVNTQLRILSEDINRALAEAMAGRGPAELTEGGSEELQDVVRNLGDILAASPLELPASDQITSRSAKKAQLEQQLKSADPYQAQCKLLISNGRRERVVEHRLTTARFHPVDGRPQTLASVARIVAHSRTTYGTAIAAIEAGMEERARFGQQEEPDLELASEDTAAAPQMYQPPSSARPHPRAKRPGRLQQRQPAAHAVPPVPSAPVTQDVVVDDEDW